MRRSRLRGNGKRHPSSRLYSVESSGPDVKVRGTAQQVLEKYLALARDASSAGDRVAAEGYFQHADHYYRLIHAEQGSGAQYGQGRGGPPAKVTPVPGSPEAAVADAAFEASEKAAEAPAAETPAAPKAASA